MFDSEWRSENLVEKQINFQIPYLKRELIDFLQSAAKKKELIHNSVVKISLSIFY
jgi:hypothetical protein